MKLRVSHDTISKLGRVMSIGRKPRATCKVMTAGCADCFAQRGRAAMSDTYSGNYDGNSQALGVKDTARLLAVIIAAFPSSIWNWLTGKRMPFRIHAPGGDFDTVEYIRLWIRIAKCLPNVDFWFYTRAWMDAELRPELERLKALPNVTGWASLDWSVPRVPAGWRLAFQGPKDAANLYPRGHQAAIQAALVCPASRGMEVSRKNGTGKRKLTCADCGWCYGKVGKSATRGVYFPHH